MLEFNKEHKKADLSHVDINTGKYKRTGKAIVAGILLSTIILFSGCGKKVSKYSDTDLNRAMISIGNEYIVFDIDGYSKPDDACIKIKLTDGTTVALHPLDVRLYNNKSETMQKVERSVPSINIDDTNSKVEDSTFDRALVSVGDDVMLVEVADYNRRDFSTTTLELTDGTELCIHPMDITLFSSKSTIMSQVQEQVLENNNKKTR